MSIIKNIKTVIFLFCLTLLANTTELYSNRLKNLSLTSAVVGGLSLLNAANNFYYKLDLESKLPYLYSTAKNAIYPSPSFKEKFLPSYFAYLNERVQELNKASKKWALISLPFFAVAGICYYYSQQNNK